MGIVPHDHNLAPSQSHSTEALKLLSSRHHPCFIDGQVGGSSSNHMFYLIVTDFWISSGLEYFFIVSFTLLVLKFLMIIGQLFFRLLCSVSSDVLLWLDLSYTSLTRITQKRLTGPVSSS